MTWLSNDEEIADLTREALADVDAGLVVDHPLVEAWAESLGTATPSTLPTPTRPA